MRAHRIALPVPEEIRRAISESTEGIFFRRSGENGPSTTNPTSAYWTSPRPGVRCSRDIRGSMQTLAQTQKPAQKQKSAALGQLPPLARGTEILGEPLLLSPRPFGSVADPRPRPSQDGGADAEGCAPAIPRFGHEFGRISLYPSGPRVIQAKLATSQRGDSYEEEADRVSRLVMRMAEPAREISGGKLEAQKQSHKPIQAKPAGGDLQPTAAPPVVHEVLRAPGQPLDPATRAFMEPRFGHDFSRVRVHSGDAAALSAQAVNAQAYTAGHNIVFGAGRFAPGTHAGQELLAHELTHVVQQSGSDPRRPAQAGEMGDLSPVISVQRSGSQRLARKTLTDLPEATRKAIKISRSVPVPSTVDSWIKDYFDPASKTSRSSPFPTEFGVEITDAQQKKGLGAIAGELVAISGASTNPDPETWPLAAGSLLDLALDLRPFGGEHAIYRFTHYADGSNDKLLIEKTQVLAPATTTGSTPPVVQPPAATVGTFTGTVSVGSVKVTIEARFGNDRGKVIADAVQLLPDPIRAKIDGVTIDFGGSGKGPGGENGNYDEMSDTVHLWGDLFDASARRVGTATSTAYQIVHELGHAVDLRPEFKAQRARTKAEEAKKALQSKIDHPPLDTSGDPLAVMDPEKSPARVAEVARLRAEIAKMDTEIANQNAAMANSKSIAGNELSTATEQLLTDFGKAIDGDGVKAVAGAKTRNAAVDTANKQAEKDNAANPTGPQKAMKAHEKALTTGVTNYAATDLMEAFAENFSTYILDEALLKALRPKTHAFFHSAFPKTTGTTP
jgi:hypothetical protein